MIASLVCYKQLRLRPDPQRFLDEVKVFSGTRASYAKSQATDWLGVEVSWRNTKTIGLVLFRYLSESSPGLGSSISTL